MHTVVILLVFGILPFTVISTLEHRSTIIHIITITILTITTR
jgi:hypothetical protein